MIKILDQYVSYNEWANTHLVNYFKNIPDDIYFGKAHNSFPSIHLTLGHIYIAEAIWLFRLNEELKPDFKDASKMQKAPFLELLLETSKAFKAFTLELSGDELNMIKSYQDSGGKQFQNLKRDMIMHCMNHSTYHRGQLITMTKQHGLEGVPSTDLLYYLRK